MIGNKKSRKLIGIQNGLKVFSKLQSKNPLKSKTKIKTVSKERYNQQMQERELKKKLMERCKGLCEVCGKPPTKFPFTLDKHEIVFRSHGGDPLNADNCLMLCRECHNQKHHLK